jgi:hypothetical protein
MSRITRRALWLCRGCAAVVVDPQAHAADHGEGHGAFDNLTLARPEARAA